MYVMIILCFHSLFITSHLARRSHPVDWADNSRDILNFLINYLPEAEASGCSDLPVQLERISESTSQIRTKQGFADRKLVCVGHSFGGASL